MPKHRKKPSRFSRVFIIIDLLVILVGTLLLTYLFVLPVFETNATNHQKVAPMTKEQATEESTTEDTETAATYQNLTNNQSVVNETNEALDKEIASSGFIGSALIVKEGKIILHKGYGYACKEKEILNQPSSLFNIGSIQKGMTGVLVMRAVAAGEMALSDRLAKYYPSIPNAENTTIQELLQMSSGLTLGEIPSGLATDTDVLNWAVAHTTAGSGKGTFQYSAVNYTLLAGILMKVTGKSYETLFTDFFIQHNKLAQTQLYTTYLQQEGRTIDYQTDGEEDPYGKGDSLSSANLISELGTGNVYMSVGDLYRFFGLYVNDKLLEKNLLNQLWERVSGSNYISGFYDKGNYYRAHGSKAGFESFALFSKDNQSSVILLTNRCSKTNVSLISNLYKEVTGVEATF